MIPRRKPVRRPSWAGRNYTLLTAAAVVSGLGSSGALVAGAFAVLAAGGSATDVGLVAAARTVPLVLFVLIGGALADRVPRHRVMVAANALNCASQGLFAVLVLTGTAQVWQMALLAALGGTGQAFFSPAAEGMVLATVSGSESGRAFAAFRMGVNGAGILGTALGGALAAATGPGWVLAADAGAFAVAAALRAFLDVRDVLFVTGVSVEVFAVAWMSALHQEIPEEKFSRVSSYDWLGSLALVPVATAAAGPVQDAVGRPAALWGCSALVLVLTLAVLCVPDVRRLTRRTGGGHGAGDGRGGGPGDGTAALGPAAPGQVTLGTAALGPAVPGPAVPGPLPGPVARPEGGAQGTAGPLR